MGNVSMPTPVAVAGGAICVLAGYLLGVVAGPDTPSRTTAVVSSFDAETRRLCLEGEALRDQEGVTEPGTLCGTWRQTEGSRSQPSEGDQFRFVSVVVNARRAGEPEGAGPVTVIYGDVVD